MAQDGGRLPILLMGLLWTANLTSCFNLEPRLNHIYSSTETHGRNPYFGFSVALQHSQNDTNLVMVGAPRANSSSPDKHNTPEPGTLFKCPLSSDTCEELQIDLEGPRVGRYKGLQNYGWLGGSLDSQPDYMGDRQATCVCAPQWKYVRRGKKTRVPGACAVAFDSISTAEFTVDSERTPLVNYLIEEYDFGQTGFAVHFPANDSTKVILGAPGFDIGTGSVVLLKDYKDRGTQEGKRKKRDAVSPDDMFSDFVVARNKHFQKDGLLGYSVTSGYFLHKDKTQYAAGAPQSADSHGKVIIFELSDEEEVVVKKELNGAEMGEYFGGALTAADINGDGLDDLVVGSPMYSFHHPNPNIPDCGRIQTFLSKQGTGPRDEPDSQHYGRNISFARFGISLASLGDLNADGYQDIAVGAPWDDNGAVYIFLGSSSGLKPHYSQRLSPEDFTPDLKGFGMSVSRGTDIDNNGYPDLAIGSFLSGHALVVKSRPVAVLSGTVTSNQSSVTWEGEAPLTLTTCLSYTGHMLPQSLNVQAKLILDRITHRAFFTDDNNNTHLFAVNLPFNETKCQDHQVTVKENKLDPRLHITMQLEYELMDDTTVDLEKRPLTDPAANNSAKTEVGILENCKTEICKVNVKTQATFVDGSNDSLVIGKKNKLRVEVSNSGEPVYVPTLIVTSDPGITLTPISQGLRDCANYNETSLSCIIDKSIKNDNKPATIDVEVEVDEEQMTSTSQVNLQVNVTGEGHELEPEDNFISRTLQLVAQASLELHGSSVQEQFPYEFTDDDQIIINDNARVNHTFILIKKGPTSVSSINLTLNIPISFTADNLDFVKVYSITPKRKKESFPCKLRGTEIADDGSSRINSAADVNVPKENNGAHSSSGSVTVSAKKGKDIGTQYFNCSSTLVNCVELICQIQKWTMDAESAEISVELEVDLSILAKHISVEGGAVFSTQAIATVQSLNPLWGFEGKKTTNGEAVTYIQPATLLDETIPWWVILLAVLGGLLLLGLLAYGLHKKGFFKREKLAELKAHRAHLESSPRGALATTEN